MLEFLFWTSVVMHNIIPFGLELSGTFWEHSKAFKCCLAQVCQQILVTKAQLVHENDDLS